MSEDINLIDGLNAAGFKQQDIPGLPEGVTAFAPAPGYKEGEIVKGGPWDGFKVASVYSRAQAIADGVLIDVTPLAKSEGFRLHTVMTCGVVAEVKAQVEKVFSDVMAFVEKEAVYWAALKDVLQALHEAIRQQKESTDTIHFKHAGLDLWSLVGPGDTAAPVLTIMLEGED